MPYVESLEEFKERMGCESLETKTGWILFENGALSNGRTHTEPPRDARQLLKIRIDFYKLKLEQTEQNAHRCKGYIITQAEYFKMGAGPSPHPQALVDLERFVEEIEALRAKLVPMYEAWYEPQRKRIEELDDDRRKRSERADEILQQVQLIDL